MYEVTRLVSLPPPPPPAFPFSTPTYKVRTSSLASEHLLAGSSLCKQVNAEDDALREHLGSHAGLTKLPYFHFFKSGALVSQFSANISKVSLLRAEIAAHKTCVGPHCAD